MLLLPVQMLIEVTLALDFWINGENGNSGNIQNWYGLKNTLLSRSEQLKKKVWVQYKQKTIIFSHWAFWNLSTHTWSLSLCNYWLPVTWDPSPLRHRSPGGGNGNPLQCSCMENPMGRGATGGGPQSMGSHRVGHDWSDWACMQSTELMRPESGVQPHSLLVILLCSLSLTSAGCVAQSWPWSQGWTRWRE